MVGVTLGPRRVTLSKGNHRAERRRDRLALGHVQIDGCAFVRAPRKRVEMLLLGSHTTETPRTAPWHTVHETPTPEGPLTQPVLHLIEPPLGPWHFGSMAQTFGLRREGSRNYPRPDSGHADTRRIARRSPHPKLPVPTPSSRKP